MLIYNSYIAIIAICVNMSTLIAMKIEAKRHDFPARSRRHKYASIYATNIVTLFR